MPIMSNTEAIATAAHAEALGTSVPRHAARALGGIEGVADPEHKALVDRAVRRYLTRSYQEDQDDVSADQILRHLFDHGDPDERHLDDEELAAAYVELVTRIADVDPGANEERLALVRCRDRLSMEGVRRLASRGFSGPGLR